MSTTIVSVTYGNRWHLLQQTLRAALDTGAAYAVVVDNGSAHDITALVQRAFPGRASTICMERNEGPAAGFRKGIELAISQGARYLFLLDDDNCVEPGAVTVLRKTFETLRATVQEDNLCVLGFRPDRQPDILKGKPQDPIGESVNGFFGFHVKDLPRKIWGRRPGIRPGSHMARAVPEDRLFRQRVAPFGGLFFHRTLIGRYGYPDARFILYCDDIEFSYRITSGGGEIWLAPAARIVDVEQSWSLGEDRMTAFGRWIKQGSDRQVFYTARNWSYFESHCRGCSWFRLVNRTIYLSILWCTAMRARKATRFKLILEAIRDGERGVLGVRPEFPLQSVKRQALMA